MHAELGTMTVWNQRERFPRALARDCRIAHTPTSSTSFVGTTFFIRSCLNFNLRPHNCGASEQHMTPRLRRYHKYKKRRVGRSAEFVGKDLLVLVGI